MTKNQTLKFIAVIILCVSLTGCGSMSDYKPLGSGYIYVTYTQHSLLMEEDSHQFALYYSPGERKRWIKVWFSAGGIVVSNDVALFIGDKAIKQPPFGERWT